MSKANFELEQSVIGMGIRKVAQVVNYDDLTDGLGTDGDITLTKQIPAGAFVIGTKVTVVTGFTGDDTAVMTVGKSAGADEYTDGTSVSVLAAGKVGDSAEDPNEYNAAAQSVYCRITGNADFTSITAGKLYVEVFYLSTEPELEDNVPNKNLI